MSQNQSDQTETSTLSGKILISGTGFIVGSGMWAILAFFRYEGGFTDVFVLNMALAVLHIVVGLLILRQTRNSWYLGLVLAVISVAATLPNHYYYLPIPVDGITGLLLYFSRWDFHDMRLAHGRGTGSV
jgi:hypothetical protein